MTTNTTAALLAALEAAHDAITSMKVEAETAAQGDEQMMLEACETISNEGLAASETIRAILSTAAAQPPAGWVMVPVEPTAMMKRAAQKADMDHSHHKEWLCDEWPDFLRVWNAMLAARPGGNS